METTTVDQVQAAAAKRRLDAAERYYTLLQRNSTPKSNDAVEIEECLAALRRSSDHLADDVGVVARIEQVEAAERDVAALLDPIAEARRALREAQAWADEQKKKLAYKVADRIRKADAQLARLNADRQAAAAIAQQADLARAAWRAIIEGTTAEAVLSRARAERTAAKRAAAAEKSTRPAATENAAP